jgi:hypothetical protein
MTFPVKIHDGKIIGKCKTSRKEKHIICDEEIQTTVSRPLHPIHPSDPFSSLCQFERPVKNKNIEQKGSNTIEHPNNLP